jgi:hypothetical protein
MVIPQNNTAASKRFHLRHPAHFFISVGFSVSKVNPRAGIVSSSESALKPRTRGMY